MSPSVQNGLAFLLVVTASITYAWAVEFGRDARAAGATPTVRGARFDQEEPPSTAGETQFDRDPWGDVTGDGTVAAPFTLRFDLLALPDYDPPSLRADPTPLTPQSLSPRLAEVDDAMVTLRGFVIAADVVDGEVKGVVLSRYPPGCCFGALPVMDEWADVEVGEKDRSTFPNRGQVEVTGRFHCGEEVSAEGRVKSLYRISAARGRSNW